MSVYVATYGVTTEKDLRAALLRQDEIKLEPPEGTDSNEIVCSAFVGNYNWLRLTFTGEKYTYYFDSTKGWFYLTPTKNTRDLLAEISSAMPNKANKLGIVYISDPGDITVEIHPDMVYVFDGELTSLTVTPVYPDGDELTQFHFIFYVGSSTIELEINDDVLMPPDFTIEANNIYEIDMLNGYVAAQHWEWSNE